MLYKVLITKLRKCLFVANHNSDVNSVTFTDTLNVNVVGAPFCRSNYKVAESGYSSITSVCLSDCLERLGPYCTDFRNVLWHKLLLSSAETILI
jgi:hypothetical protein